jgi:chromosome segregation ATPase
VNVSPATEKALFDAMARLILGKPRHTDGAMTKENLYKEAQVSRATMNRATAVMAEWDAHITEYGKRTVGETRRDADLAALSKKLKDKTRECTELQQRLDAAATVIAALHHDNQALREELTRHGGTVISLSRQRGSGE